LLTTEVSHNKPNFANTDASRRPKNFYSTQSKGSISITHNHEASTRFSRSEKRAKSWYNNIDHGGSKLPSFTSLFTFTPPTERRSTASARAGPTSLGCHFFSRALVKAPFSSPTSQPSHTLHHQHRETAATPTTPATPAAQHSTAGDRRLTMSRRSNCTNSVCRTRPLDYGHSPTHGVDNSDSTTRTRQHGLDNSDSAAGLNIWTRQLNSTARA
jgi:hypothetical protein